MLELDNIKSAMAELERRGVLEFYTLTDYPLHNMNSDEFGRPKSAYINNCVRDYLSSQSQKRPMRVSDLFKALGKPAIRSRLFPNVVFNKLVEDGISERPAAILATAFAGKAIPITKKEKEDKTNGKIEKKLQEQITTLKEGKSITEMAFLSDEEIERNVEVAKAIYAEHEDDIETFIYDILLAKKNGSSLFKAKYRKLYKTPATMTLDQALFGRMVADDSSMTINAALSVAPSVQIGTSNANIDYLTAVEELGDNTGSGHITENLFTSGIYNGYCSLDLDQLHFNCSGMEEPERQYVSGAAVMPLLIAFTNPSGKQSNFASQTLPSFIGVVFRKAKHRATAADAFSVPDNDPDVKDAIKKLTEQCEKKFNSSIFAKPDHAACFCLEKDAQIPDCFERVDTIDDLCEKIAEWISA